MPLNNLFRLLLWTVACAAASAAAAEGECAAVKTDELLSPKNIPTAKLANGVELPLLSLGTAHAIVDEGMPHQGSNKTFVGFIPEKAYRQVELALQKGIRSFDTALMYGTQPHLGHVLANWWASGKLQNREDVFITTKVFHQPEPDFGLAANHQVNYESMTPEEVTKQTAEHVEQCLKELGVGYIDVMLLHWPSIEGQTEEISRKRRLAAWKVLELFYERGWLRAIGVSNFNEKHLQDLMDDGAKIRPVMNQIEASPYLQFTNIVEYCQSHDILVQSFSPLGAGQNDVKDNQLLKEIATKHQKDVGQVVFRYLIQRGYAVAYLTNSEKRMVSNQDVFDFELSSQEVADIDSLNRKGGTWGLPNPYDLP